MKARTHTIHIIKHLRIINVGFLAVIVSIALSGLPTHAQEAVIDNNVFLPLVAQKFDPACDVLPEEIINLSPTPYLIYNAPKLAIDHSGRPHIFWETLQTPRYAYHTFLAESGWSSPSPIAGTLGISYITSEPIFDLQGTLHIMWLTDLGIDVTNRYQMVYANFDGDQWSAYEDVSQSTSMTNGKLRVVSDGNLQAVIETTYRVYRNLRSNFGWETAQLLDPGHTTNFGWPDVHGGVHLYGAFFYLPNLYSYWKDGIYSPQSVEVPVALSSRKTMLDEQNNLHTTWTGSVPIPGDTVTGVYYQCQNNNLSWQPQWNPSGYGALTGNPYFAWDDHNRVALAWQVKEPHEVHMAFWEGCTYQITDYFPLPTGEFELVDAAYSSVAQKACVLLRKQYTSTEYRLLCANVNR